MKTRNNSHSGSQRPVRVPVVVQRPDRYGWVDGLEPDEHADPEKLEYQAFQQFWWPVLQLPKRIREGPRPTIDESGRLDFGAFGTVDYERLHGPFDNARYKRGKLRDQLEDVLITLSIVAERLPGRAKYQVLGYLRRGVIDSERSSTTTCGHSPG